MKAAMRAKDSARLSAVRLLLAAMKNATDLRSWTARLTKRVQEYSGDDASLVAIAFGYPTYAAMQQAFRPRLSWLDENFAKPIRDIDWKQERERFVELRKSCWEDYRSGYERLIPATGASQ